jgi:hypothetical protein
MELWQKIVEAYPELADDQYSAFTDKIILRDDSDGAGAYIAEWNYSKPLPEGLTVGK